MIAEFMGKEIYQKYHESHYHTSWDWLMPVVDKINETEWEDTIVDHLHQCVMRVQIEDAFNSVCEFIEWHNDNSK